MQWSTGVAATRERYQLGEGPVWDPARGFVWWVDISAHQVLAGRLSDGAIAVEASSCLRQTVGAVAPGEGGEVIVAARHDLLALAPGSGATRRLASVLDPDGASRLNDGATDPEGRYLVGSLNLESDESRIERLVRWDPRTGVVDTLDDDLTLSNGLAWSPGGTILYSVDTLRRVIFRRDYDAESGACGPRSVLLELSDAIPDGLTVDAEGALWLALWGAGEVRRYTPTGSLVGGVRLPVPNTTCPAFVGPDLRTLVVTTATDGLTPEQLAEYPESGRLFAVDVGVQGLPTPLVRGVRPGQGSSTSLEG